MKNKSFKIAETTINPGEKKIIELPAASLYTQTPINIPIHVMHGQKRGHRLFVIGAIHGDEINGVEIIRRLLLHLNVKYFTGTLIAIPVANIHGFITLSRYLPDRRDLNRAFPGSKSGSLAARLANLYMEEVISQCDYGIDLHTGNIHSDNLPHLRTSLDVSKAMKVAKAFNVPVVLDARIRDGSLRQAARELRIPVLVYEGGEALRFNEIAIRIGVRGIMNVLRELNMIKKIGLHKQKRIRTRLSRYSVWARSPKSGIFHQQRILGADVEQGEKLGFIADPFTKKETEIYSPVQGVILGRNTLPLVNEGDALFNIAEFKNGDKVTSEVNELQNYLLDAEYYPL